MGPNKEIPFLRGLPEAHKSELVKRKEDVQHIQKWMSRQSHLPKISDEHALLFLHSCEFSLERSKNTIETYFTIRTAVPELFANRNPTDADMKLAFDITNMASLSQTTPKGYRVLLFRLRDRDPAKANVTELMKAFFLFADMCISEDGLAPGYIVLFDMKGVSLGHLPKVSLPMLKRFMVYIQEAHPARLKAIIVINCVSFMDRVMALVKPLMKSELMDLLHLHSGGPESITEKIPLDILPEDYGGKAKPTQEIHDEWRARLEKEYAKWFRTEEGVRVDESKRIPGNGKTQGQLFGMEGSFRKLAID